MTISRISLKNWHYRKKCTVISASILREHNRFQVSSKLRLDVTKIIWVLPTINYTTNITSTKNVFKILTILCLEIPFSKNSYTDTSQMIQLTGFYMIRVFTERYYRINVNTLPAKNDDFLPNKVISQKLHQ